MINGNKYESKVKVQGQNQYLDYLNFQKVNKIFELSFECNVIRTGHTRYSLPKVEIKGYNVMICGKNFFDQPVENVITFKKLQQVNEIITQPFV